MELRIDPEFRDVIPKNEELDNQRYAALEEEILRVGYVRNPIVVWKEENTIADGHHRWGIIQKHWDTLKDKFSIDYVSFPNRWAVIDWICSNQDNQHNLTDEMRAYLLKTQYEARQKSSGGQIGNNNAEKRGGQNLHLDLSHINDSEIPNEHKPDKTPKTRLSIAKEHNISEGAVKSAVEFGRGVDSGEAVYPGFKQKVLSGEVKTTKKNISELRKLEPEARKEKVQRIIEGRKDDAEKKNMTPPKGYKKQMEFLHDADKKARDSDSAVDFTGDMLVDMVRNNTDGWASSLKNMLVTRSTYLVGDTRDKVAKEIEEFIKKINNIKEILK